MSLNSKKIYTKSVVTGASGFIGVPLVKSLLEKEEEVIVVDINPPKEKSCRSYIRDVSEKNSLDDIVDDETIIYHLAAKASVPESVVNPIDDFDNTCYGIFQVLETARKKNCKVIFPSTASIFDPSNKLPVTERSYVKPSSPYGAAKVSGEAYCYVYNRCYGIDVRVARMFSVYGIGMNRFFIHDVIKKIQNDKFNLTLLGDGKQIRDYLYIDDVVKGLQDVANYGLPGEDYNLASGQKTNLIDLANKIAIFMGVPEINISWSNESFPGDVPMWYGDISKIKNIGFKPKITLDEGLQKTIDWLNSN